MGPQATDTELPDRRFELEREKVSIERQKLELEFRKLKIESRKVVFTAGSIAIPLLGVMVTVLVGYLSEHARADTDFQLKAAEIVMAHQNPHEMKGRAGILRTLFPQRLPKDFGENFDDQKYSVPIPSDEKALIQLLVDHKDQRADIIRMWRIAYPNEKWVEDLAPPADQKK